MKTHHFIREWRQHRGMTLEQLGDRMNMTGAHIARVERGQVAYTQPLLEGLAAALRTEPGYLISVHPEEPQNFFDVWRGLGEREKAQAEAIIKALAKTAEGRK